MASRTRSTTSVRAIARARAFAAVTVAAVFASLITAPLGAQALDGPAASGSDLVEVTDSALASCLTSALDVAPGTGLTRDALASLTVLDCSESGINNVDALQFATHLTVLNLSGNGIADASALGALQSLKTLNISGQKIESQSVERAVLAILPAVKSPRGDSIPLAVSSSSEATGSIVGNTVAWACAGVGQLAWTVSAPFGSAEATTSFDGMVTQEVTEGSHGACSLVNTSSPVIDGTPLLDQTLTALTGTWDDGVTLFYEWSRNGIPVATADKPNYMLTDADLGSTITVTVRGEKPGHTAVALSSAPTAVIGGGILVTRSPTIEGTPTVGKTLTAVAEVEAGAWTAGTLFSYRWLRDGASISGATASTYGLTNADAGAAITVDVTGTKSGYAPVTMRSAATAMVDGGMFTAASASISGTARVGQTLTATAGSWSSTGAALTYQWNRAGMAIADAKGATYKVVATDAGQSITVDITGTKSGFVTLTKTSAASAVEKLLTKSSIPTISGSGRVGQTLTASAGEWAPAPVTVNYQWKRDGAAISGATNSSYVLASEDAGTAITVVATGSKAGYTPVALGSTPTSIEKVFTASPIPTISGTARVGQSLSAAAGTWTPETVTLKYQWNRAGSAIPGATGSTYKLVTADAGAAITVSVTGSRTGYTTITTTSTARTVEKLLTSTPTPTLTGTPRVGQTLTATAGAWAPGSVAMAYQWKRDGTAIAGATTSTYKLITADAGKAIAVTVTGRRAGYTSVDKTSSAKSVEKLLTVTPIPTLSGTARVGQTLKATAGTWSPATVTLNYQWKRAGATISGATSSSYTLVTADAGQAITVTVTGSKSGYTSVGKTSAARAVEKLFTVTPVPTISGKSLTGTRLTAKPGTWGPAPVTLTYQWQRNGTAISGATSSSYIPSAADIGTGISVVVRGAKAGYTSVSKTSARTAAVTLKTAIPRDGTYLVGSEIAAGTYVTNSATDFCYWERVSGFDGSLDSIVANDIGFGQRIVTISATDVGFTTSRCGTWIRLVDLKTSAKTTMPDSGVLAVGQQVKPGLYRAQDGNGGCYWATLSGFSGDLDSIIDNDFTYDAQPIMRVPAWAVGVEVSGCGTWTRIGD